MSATTGTTRTGTRRSRRPDEVRLSDSEPGRAPVAEAPAAAVPGGGLPKAASSDTGPMVRVRGCCVPLDSGPFTAEEQLRVLADLEALAHPIRLRLLAALAANPGRVCVCDLEAIVPVKQPTVSHHLRKLREVGLVDAERDGLWAYYRIRRDVVGALADRVGLALAHLAGSVPQTGAADS